jgi:prevent-host-death family protein
VDQEIKELIISELAKASSSDHPITINYKGKPLAIVLSPADYQKLQAEREEKMQGLKVKLNGILALIRSHTQERTLEEIEAQLAALRQEIEQELE